jgi:O-antigen ligase/polysaccharide polymerase Wzy-like membrane protein
MLYADKRRSRLQVLPSHSTSMIVLIAGVPALFAIYTLAGFADFKLVYATLGLMLIAAMARGLGNFFNRTSLLAFHSLFGVLLLTSIPTILRSTAFATYAQVQTLTICYLWSSGFVLAFVFLRTRDDVARTLDVLRHVGTAVTLSVYVALGLWLAAGIAFGEVVDVYGQFRVFGPLGDQVGFVIVLFALWSLVRGRWIQLTFHAGAIMLTATRGAIIAVVVGALWVLLARISGRHTARRFRATQSLAFATIVIVAFMRMPFMSTTYDRLGAGDAIGPDTFSDRIGAVQLGLIVVHDNPIFGVGYGGFRDHVDQFVVGRYFAENVDVERGTFTTTNQYVQTAADGGVPALACLLWFGVLLIRNSRRSAAAEHGQVRDGLVAIHGYTVAMLVGNQSAVWLLPHASSGFFLLIAAGIAERALAINESAAGEVRAAPVRRPLLRNPIEELN